MMSIKKTLVYTLGFAVLLCIKAEVDVGTNSDHGNTERLEERLNEVMKQLSQLQETVHKQATRITELTSTTQDQLHLIQSQQTDISSLHNTLVSSTTNNCSCHEHTPHDDQNHKTSAESLKSATTTGHRRASGQQISANAEPEAEVEVETEVEVDRRGPGAQTGSFDCGMSQFWNDGAAGGYTRTKAFSYKFNTTYPRPPQVFLSPTRVNMYQGETTHYGVMLQEVHQDGFTMRCGTWDGDQYRVWDLQVAWISVPA